MGRPAAGVLAQVCKMCEVDAKLHLTAESEPVKHNNKSGSISGRDKDFRVREGGGLNVTSFLHRPKCPAMTSSEMIVKVQMFV